jgi:predicted deacylase
MSWTQTRVLLPDSAGFDRWRLDSGTPGLRVVIFGGTYGDETEGVIAASRIAGLDLGLASGTVEVVPVVHEAAFAADTRTSPHDGGDLARSFPGRADGTPTQALAHALYTQVLAPVGRLPCDLLIDLHTAGRNLVMARKLEIDALLANLNAASGYHFDADPDAVDWSNVGTLDEVARRLRAIAAFLMPEEGR